MSTSCPSEIDPSVLSIPVLIASVKWASLRDGVTTRRTRGTCAFGVRTVLSNYSYLILAAGEGEISDGLSTVTVWPVAFDQRESVTDGGGNLTHSFGFNLAHRLLLRPLLSLSVPVRMLCDPPSPQPTPPPDYWFLLVGGNDQREPISLISSLRSIFSSNKLKHGP